MRQVPLGSTGLMVSEAGFGGIPLIRLDFEQSAAVLKRAFERGINFFDTANMYMDSEEKIGKALSGERSRIVLASKTTLREGEKALEHLALTLSRLKTDYLDLYQLHNVSQESDVEAIAAPGGVLEAMRRAKEKGMIRHLGVSSHHPGIALRLVQSGWFETIQFPFNFVENEPVTGLLPAAREAGMGFIAMKPFAGGMLPDAGVAFKFLRRYPEAIPIPGFDSVEKVDEVVAIYEKPNVVAAEDEIEMERQRAELGKQFCRRCQYCHPCPHGVRIMYAQMYRVAAIRMSPERAVKFSADAMESVRLCEQCGECETKCPYGLPIMTMLEENLALYDSHRAQCSGE